MDRDELYELLHRRPFEPFRLHLSDGRVYDVRYPEMNLVGQKVAWIGVLAPGETDPDPIPDHSDRIILEHVNRVEMLGRPTAAADRPRT